MAFVAFFIVSFDKILMYNSTRLKSGGAFLKEILKQLTNLYGPPGYENIMAETLSKMFSEYCDEVVIDKLYNVIATKKANHGSASKFKLMVAAHMDEIAMIITRIDDNGFIRFTAMGGIDPRILPSQEVIVHGKRELLGVIGTKPPHLLLETEIAEPLKIEKFYIDTGMRKEQLNEIVQVGDVITFKSNWTELQNDMVSSKSLDNRAGVAVMLGLLKELQHTQHDVDVVCVASVQEEVGLRGAKVSAFGINPDAAIVIDGCHGDMPGVEKSDTCELGKGPAIGVGPNLYPELVIALKSIAKEENISYQIDVEPDDTGTDAWAIQITKAGIPTALVSFPLRYMHTTVETINLTDLKNTIKLVSHFVNKLGERLEGFQCF